MDGGDIKKGHYRKKHCSPKKGKLSYSCLSSEILYKIAKALNKLDDININYKQLDDKQLYDEICNTIQSNFNCKTEACWLNIRKLMMNLSKKDAKYFREYFRPKMPEEIVKDYTEWISNFDIESVLDQYHNDLDDFYFYGAVPRDFRKCSVSELCKINISKHLNNGETKLGIVFNTDDSDGDGEHWNAMYIDLIGTNLDGQPGIYFFDSFGSRPFKEVKQLIKKIEKQGKKKDIEFIVSHNEKAFQRNTYACGFYCIHFIEHMIMGYPFKKYIKSGLTDKKMKEYQRHCYLHPDEIKIPKN